MSYALSFVEGDMFVCIICNSDMKCQFAFDVINTINYMDVWVKSLFCVLIADEVCYRVKWSLESCPLILSGMASLFLGGIFSVDLITTILFAISGVGQE